MKKILLIIGTIGILTFLILLMLFLDSLKKPSPSQPLLPVPTQVPTSSGLTVKKIQNAPTLAPEKGSGIDMNSKTIQDAIQERKKIAPYLPFEASPILSTGIPIIVRIPPVTLEPNPWIISIAFIGIDYQISPESPDYAATKKSFREAVIHTFAWLTAHNVDPKKLYINWGDKEYIQNVAEAWLEE